MGHSVPKSDKTNQVVQEVFVGGESIDWRNGIQGSILQSEAMDFRQKASQMSVLPGAYPISTSLSDLPIVMCQTPDGVRYMVGDTGCFYKESTSKVVTKISTLNSNGGAGLVYQQQSDNLYMSGQQTVSLYGQVLAGTDNLLQDNFGPSASVAPGVIYIYDSTTLSYDGQNSTARNNLNTLTMTGITPTNYATQVTNTLTNYYTLPNAIAETATNFCPFIPDIEPFYGVAAYVKVVGTGNWTLTMHDSLNNNLGAVTILHAAITTGWNLFKFASPGIRAIINPIANGTGSGNHFHLTSSVSSDTAAVYTINSSDLTGCNFVLFAYRLVQTNNGWHPMANFNQYLCIGNGNYLSTYNYQNDSSPNNTQWVRHQLQTDIGFEITSLSVNNQNLVVLAEKRSLDTSRNYQEGYIYIWDGINATWNQKIPVPIGAPYAASSSNGVTYFICAGSLYAWGGGSQFYKVRYIAYQNTDYLGMVDSTIVNPNMMGLRYGILLIGYPSSTTNVNLKYGVRTWGAVELTYPNSFGLSYMPSVRASQGMLTTTTTSNYRIGMVYNFVDTMYISWSYVDSASVAHYGLDVVDNFSTPAANYSAWNLIWDGGQRWKIKKGLRVKINFMPLPTNTTLTVGFILDRAMTPDAYNASPTTNVTAQAVAGATSVVTEIDNNFYEATWGIVGTCVTGSGAPTVPPIVTGWAYELDILSEAQDLRADEITSGTSSEGS